MFARVGEDAIDAPEPAAVGTEGDGIGGKTAALAISLHRGVLALFAHDSSVGGEGNTCVTYVWLNVGRMPIIIDRASPSVWTRGGVGADGTPGALVVGCTLVETVFGRRMMYRLTSASTTTPASFSGWLAAVSPAGRWMASDGRDSIVSGTRVGAAGSAPSGPADALPVAEGASTPPSPRTPPLHARTVATTRVRAASRRRRRR